RRRPAAQPAAVIDGMRDRGLIGDDGWLSESGRAVKQRVETLTDDLAAKPYESLEQDELDELVATLEPLVTMLLAAQDRAEIYAPRPSPIAGTGEWSSSAP